MDNLLMNARERRRLTEFSRVKDGVISVAEAAWNLGISLRQGRRVWKAYRLKGDRGLMHGLKGRPGNARKEQLRRKVVAAYRATYRGSADVPGLNAAHFAEMLLRKDKLALSRQTSWRWLKEEDLIVAPRRSRQHRRRRERKACVGELIQMDGSTHRWLGKDRPASVLFVMVDDASGKVFCRFYDSEDTASAFDLFGRYVRQSGLPAALYVDHDSIYVVNDALAREKARVAGKKPPLTQFGRAMEELGVRIMTAASPQAKGRVERMNRTLQDRLLKELLLELVAKDLGDLAAAHAFLKKEFLTRFNQRFAKTPANGTNLHRALPKGLSLQDVLCIKETRTVGQDWCVRFDNRILQITRRHAAQRLPGKKVEVWQHSDGKFQLHYRGTRLDSMELGQRPVKAPDPRPRVFRAPWKPGPDHPYRKGLRPPRRSASAPLQSGSLRSPSFRSADADRRDRSGPTLTAPPD